MFNSTLKRSVSKSPSKSTYGYSTSHVTEALTPKTHNISTVQNKTVLASAIKVIDKLKELGPFLDQLIARQSERTGSMVGSLTNLNSTIDAVFMAVSADIQSFENQNEALRNNLDDLIKNPPRGKEVDRLERVIEGLTEENRENKTALREAERVYEENRELIESIRKLERQHQARMSRTASQQSRTLEELDGVKNQLERERRKASEVEQYWKEKNVQIEKQVQDKVAYFERENQQLVRKTDLNQGEIRRLKQALEQESKRSENLGRQIAQKVQEAQATNIKLKKKVRFDEQQLAEHKRLIESLQEKNSKAEHEFMSIKSLMDKERRDSMVAQDELMQKLRKAEQDNKLIISQQEEFLNITEKERRQSMSKEREATQKLKELFGDNKSLSEVAKALKEKIQEAENNRLAVEQQLRDRERQYKEQIDQLARKSHLSEDEIRMLKRALDQERGKSMADEATIRKLQSAISEQTSKTKQDIALLQQELDKERRKSMADQALIRQMEKTLNQKLYFINESQNKYSLAEKEISFLKDQIDKERRKSMADQAKIKKMEQLMQEKMGALEQAVARNSKNDEEIYMLKQEIDAERRKSMADQAKIRKLEEIVAEKIRNANESHNKYLELARKTEMDESEIRKLKQEIDNERRKSMADQAKIKRLEQILAEKENEIINHQKRNSDTYEEIQFLKQEIDAERRKSMADQAKIKKLQEILRQKTEASNALKGQYDQQIRKTELNEQQMRFLMAEIEKERKKSMADIATIQRLQKLLEEKAQWALENENKFQKQVDFLNREIENERRKSMADEAKIKKLEGILNQKLQAINDLERRDQEHARMTGLNQEEIRMLKQELDNERRKSLADEAKIRKIQQILSDNERKNQHQVELLKQEIQNERRKSMADEAKVKRLEKELQERTSNYNSKLNDETRKFESFREEVEKERRGTMVEKEAVVRKIRQLQDEKQDVIRAIEDFKNKLGQAEVYIRELEGKVRSAEGALREISRKAEVDTQRLAEQNAAIKRTLQENESLIAELAHRAQQAEKIAGMEMGQLRKALSHKEGQLDQLHDHNMQLSQILRSKTGGMMSGSQPSTPFKRYKDGTTDQGSESDAMERSHVIKVLQHESRVFRLESSLNNLISTPNRTSRLASTQYYPA